MIDEKTITRAAEYAKVFRGAATGIYNKLTENGPSFRLVQAGQEYDLSYAEAMMAAFNGIAEVFEKIAEAATPTTMPPPGMQFMTSSTKHLAPLHGMVERVARAICIADGFPPDIGGQRGANAPITMNWEEFVKHAQAALAAMPEPQLVAFVESIGDASGPYPDLDGHRIVADSRAALRAGGRTKAPAESEG